MGSYLVPTQYVAEAQGFLGVNWRVGCSFSPSGGGVLFSDPALTDAECAALFAGFTSAWPAGLLDTERPLPTAVADAVTTFVQFRNTNPATLTQAQIVALFKATAILLKHLNHQLG